MIVTGIFIARLEHFLLAHFTHVLHAEGVQASDLLVEVVQDDEFGLLYIVTTFNHRSMHIFTA